MSFYRAFKLSILPLLLVIAITSLPSPAFASPFPQAKYLNLEDISSELSESFPGSFEDLRALSIWYQGGNNLILASSQDKFLLFSFVGGKWVYRGALPSLSFPFLLIPLRRGAVASLQKRGEVILKFLSFTSRGKVTVRELGRISDPHSFIFLPPLPFVYFQRGDKVLITVIGESKSNPRSHEAQIWELSIGKGRVKLQRALSFSLWSPFIKSPKIPSLNSFFIPLEVSDREVKLAILYPDKGEEHFLFIVYDRKRDKFKAVRLMKEEIRAIKWVEVLGIYPQESVPALLHVERWEGTHQILRCELAKGEEKSNCEAYPIPGIPIVSLSGKAIISLRGNQLILESLDSEALRALCTWELSEENAVKLNNDLELMKRSTTPFYGLYNSFNWRGLEVEGNKATLFLPRGMLILPLEACPYI